MKKQVLFIAIAGLFTAMASAADLYVRDFGAGGSYATISAAITAASNGDRIIIKPKSGGLPYIENLTIDKSLSFVSENNFAKYIVQGSISITPFAGRVVTINNLSITNEIALSDDTTGGRTTINVFNSNAVSISARHSNSTLNVSGCVVSSIISLYHGRITGNRCTQIEIDNQAIDSNPATDDIELIANALSATASNGAAIILTQKNYGFKVLNNFLTSAGLSISAVKTSSNNEIRNNVINAGSNSAVNINLSASGASGTALISIVNNVLSTTSSSSSVGEIVNTGSPSATVYAFYNMSGNPFVTYGVTSASNNFSNASIIINTAPAYIVTGVNSDAGYPEDEYADIDLSRNDIGNYGGSDSWNNYWPAVSNKPQVNYLNTPRRIYSGTTEMNATGAANSK